MNFDGLLDWLKGKMGSAQQGVTNAVQPVKDFMSDAVFHNPFMNSSGLGAAPGVPQQKNQPAVIDIAAEAQKAADRARKAK